MRMVQIIACHYDHMDGGTRSYVVVGLDNKGSVWRYDHACKGWVAYKMAKAECASNAHKR